MARSGASLVSLILVACGSAPDFPDPPSPSRPCDGSYHPAPIDFSTATALTPIGHDEQGLWILSPGSEGVGFDPNGVAPDDELGDLLPAHLQPSWPPEALDPALDVWDVSGVSRVEERDLVQDPDGGMRPVALERFDAEGRTVAHFRTGAGLEALSATHTHHDLPFGTSRIEVEEVGWTWTESLTDERGLLRIEALTIDPTGGSSLPERPTSAERSAVTVHDYDAWGHIAARITPTEQATLIRATEPRTAADGRTFWPQLALDAPLRPGERFAGASLDGGQTRLVQLEDVEIGDDPRVPAYRAVVLCPAATRDQVLVDRVQIDATIDGRLLAVQRVRHEDGLAQVEVDRDGDGVIDLDLRRERLDRRGSVRTTFIQQDLPTHVEVMERDRQHRPLRMTHFEDDELVLERLWIHP